MNEFLNTILKLIGKEFFEWYNKTYTVVPLKTFLSLPELMQYPIVAEYITIKYNIGIHFDIGSVVAYYFNPELAYNEIRTLSLKNNKFTTVILEEYDLEVLSYKDSYKRAILNTINKLENPF